MTAEQFLTELQKIIDLLPKPPVYSRNSENSNLTNQVFYAKNCTYVFDSTSCSDCTFVYDSYLCSKCLDCDYAVESQLCYESTDAIKCFNCNYIHNCLSVTDSEYTEDCGNCHDLFGCYRLSNKSFCIFNRQLSEAEYKEKVKEYKAWPPEKVLATLEELKKRYPKTQTHEYRNKNSSYGDWFNDDIDCYMMFDAGHSEKCAYMYDSFYNKMCMDATYSSQHNELSYQIVDSGDLFNCNYSVFSQNCQDSSYLFSCFNANNCLGCVNLSHKQYCILNRQFSKEEYERISKAILDDINRKNLGFADLTFR